MIETNKRNTILLVESRYYEKISKDLAAGAETVITDAGFDIERIEVSGVFEIPAACEMVIMAGKADPHRAYAGILALGCVIRGETDHYDHICREASRALMEISVRHTVPLGFGVLTCENGKQAEVRADPKQKNKGAEAARACLRMIELQHELLGGDV